MRAWKDCPECKGHGRLRCIEQYDGEQTWNEWVPANSKQYDRNDTYGKDHEYRIFRCPTCAAHFKAVDNAHEEGLIEARREQVMSSPNTMTCGHENWAMGYENGVLGCDICRAVAGTKLPRDRMGTLKKALCDLPNSEFHDMASVMKELRRIAND
jgi:hypothetical protein